MRKQIAAAMLAGLAMLAGSAALADGMSRGSMKDAPVALPTWSGYYIGAGIGYGHLTGENNYSEPGFSSSWSGEGAAGGLGTIVLGFDRQVRERYVVGLFTEFDWSSIELTYQDTLTPLQTFRLESTFSVGARAGFLLTQTSLLYMTAGYSWSHGKSDGYFDIDGGLAGFFPGVSKLDLSGPFIGLGMETLLGKNLSLRGEVRYTMYGEEVTNSDPGIPFTDKFDANLLTGRLAVVYKFNREESRVEPIK